MPETPSADWARPVVHFEILARVTDVQRAFHTGLFNWPIGDGPTMNFPSVPGGPTIASIDDPEGNPLVLVQQ